MTGRMFLLTPSEWGAAGVGDTVHVTGPEGRHAVGVIRVRVGDELLVSDGAGRRASVVVTEAGPGQLSGRIVELVHAPEPSPRFVLVQALAKGDRDEQAVEAATELGVDEVLPWQAARSIVQWRGADREEKGRRRWEAVAAAAAKQSRRARVPVVGPIVRGRGLSDLVESAALAVVLHEDAERPLAGTRLPAEGDVVLVVGPEGGITPEELAALAAAGAQVVRLGPEVLRSSTAGPAALAVLSAASRWA